MNANEIRLCFSVVAGDIATTRALSRFQSRLKTQGNTPFRSIPMRSAPPSSVPESIAHLVARLMEAPWPGSPAPFFCNQRHGPQQSKAVLFQPLTALIQVPSCRSTSTLRRVLLSGSKSRLHCRRDRTSSLWDLAAELTKESLSPAIRSHFMSRRTELPF